MNKPEPLKKQDIFAVNLDGDGVASKFPKDGGGNDACLSDNWIKVIPLDKHKSVIEYIEERLKPQMEEDFKRLLNKAFEDVIKK